MKFLIQHTSINIKHLHKIREAMVDYPHEYIGMIPFSRKLISKAPLLGTDYIPYGSVLLSEYAYENNWKGLCFDPILFTYRKSLENRDDMLNDGLISVRNSIKLLETMDKEKLIFTRPSKDLKQYSGQLIKVHDLLDWFNMSLNEQAKNLLFLFLWILKMK